MPSPISNFIRTFTRQNSAETSVSSSAVGLELTVYRDSAQQAEADSIPATHNQGLQVQVSGPAHPLVAQSCSKKMC